MLVTRPTRLQDLVDQANEGGQLVAYQCPQREQLVQRWAVGRQAIGFAVYLSLVPCAQTERAGCYGSRACLPAGWME